MTGHCDIGDGAVVGTRAMVRGQKIPPPLPWAAARLG